MKLNIGSGPDYRSEWINLEKYKDSDHHVGETINPDVFADAHYLPFKDSIFDQIDIIHTLEHLERPVDCLKEIKRIAKPSAEIIIEVPNPEIVIEHIHGENDDHLYSWTEWTFKYICEYAGLEIINYYKEDYPSEGGGHRIIATIT